MYKSLDQYTRLATFKFQNVSGLVIDVASVIRGLPRSLRFPPSPPTGGTHQWPEIRGEARSPGIFFSALRASVWSKNKRGSGGWGVGPPLDPLLHTD